MQMRNSVLDIGIGRIKAACHVTLVLASCIVGIYIVYMQSRLPNVFGSFKTARAYEAFPEDIILPTA
ncbi:hypothetical protein [Brevibacillus halotolerans]|uniref:hypothetical protein n=1 Tax=Brevibacillus halotolerans TaxID=1507437 RepID=UPI0015EE5F07|nr:hypothetical protein [Brevibacillus halotolerans]MBA4532849.1 hypothetical protein [Brevibacillus halotolerans]